MQVQSFSIVHEGQALPPISLSAGIAMITDQTHDVADALRSADAALYQAKRDGRNRTVVAAQLPWSTTLIHTHEQR